MIPAATREHYSLMRTLQERAVRLGRLNGVLNLSPLLIAGFTAIQLDAAEAGATYAAMTLAEQDSYTPPDAIANIAAFAGFASDGRSLDGLLEQPSRTVARLRQEGAPLAVAVGQGRDLMDMIMRTQVADVARQASGVDITSRAGVGYVRMVRPGACARCAVLAGKWFRWNAGFLRHPRCSCVHVANRAGSTKGAMDEGLVQDPYQTFSALPRDEQDRIYGKANAAAIRDGADISQVVNSRRGMSPNGYFTTEGTSKRGNAAQNLRQGQRRLTPEAIYKQAEKYGGDDPRAYALDLLRTHGYVLPGGQIPTGALRGQREGWGQLGSGGGVGRSAADRVRVGARRDIEEARRTGIRDPRNRNMMTAAERRLYDAERRYLDALAGRSPNTSPGFGNTPDPYGLGLNRGSTRFVPATQAELAAAEREYRRLLGTRGQIFTR